MITALLGAPPRLPASTTSLLLLLLLACCSGSARRAHPADPAPEDLPDVDHSEKTTLTLRHDGARWQLTSATQVSIRYQTRRATQTVTHSVYEPFFARVEDLEARKDGSSLSSDQIEKVTLQHRGVLLADDHRYLLKFKSVELGQTVSWSYRQTYEEIGWAPRLYVENLDRVKRYEVEVLHPPGVKVDFELFFPRQRFRPTIARGPGRTSITFSDLPHLQPLEYFGYNDVHVVIWPRFRQGGQAIAPISAAEFLRWQAGRLRARPAAPLGAGDRALLTRITAGATLPRDKLRRIYDWVRKNVRYVADERGLHGVVPHAPSYVIKQRYGDCKDLSNLVIQLAAATGVAAVPVFVAVKPRPRFAGVNDSMYDHQIAAFREEQRWLFLDPVCEHCEFGNLPEMDIDKPALVLAGDAGDRLEIPAPPQRPSVELVVRARTAALDRAAASIVLRNEAFSSAMEIRRLSAAKQRTRFSKLLGRELYAIRLSAIKVDAVADDHVRLSARVDLSGFVVKSDRRLYLPMVAIRARTSDLLERRRDDYPIRFEGRDNVLLRLRLAAPDHAPRPSPPLVLGSQRTATIRSSLGQEGGVAVAEYRLWQHRKRFEGPRRAELLELFGAYLRSRKQMFVLEQTGGPGPDGGVTTTPTTREGSSD